MSDSSAIFSGTSRYSSDFQAVIERAVAIASLPLAQLSSRKTELDSESQALGRLQNVLDGVRGALSGVASAIGPASWTATVSDPATVRATLGSGAAEGSHTIEITSLGTYTSTMSSDTCARVADSSAENISGSASFTLTVDGQGVTVTPQAATLESLVSAINQAGLDVQAAAVNIGTPAAPDYRLAVRGTKLRDSAIQLADASGSLLETLATGYSATYRLDGAAITLRSESRTVEIAPAVKIEFLRKSEPGVETQISVARGATAAASALNAFRTAYNAAMQELDSNRGKGNGALAGQSILLEMADSLRNCALCPGSGAISSLADLGLTFDQSGTLSFDAAAFGSAAAGNAEELGSFLDSFVKRGSELLDAVPLASEKNSVSAALAAQQDRIDAEQTRIDDLRANLVAQMSAADAMVAMLEQRASYVTNLFESMRIASRAYNG